jgi:hypothetical protein
MVKNRLGFQTLRAISKFGISQRVWYTRGYPKGRSDPLFDCAMLPEHSKDLIVTRLFQWLSSLKTVKFGVAHAIIQV